MYKLDPEHFEDERNSVIGDLGRGRLAILFSGGGSTAEAVYKAILDGSLPGLDLVVAITNKPNAAGISKLRALGLDSIYICDKDFSCVHFEKGYSSQVQKAAGSNMHLIELLKHYQVGLIAQLGWLAKTPIDVVNHYQGRIINQHPGPLDPGRHADFGGRGMYGLRVHAARLHFAINTGKHNAWTEATSHYVTEEYDEGDLIATKRIAIPEELLALDLANDEAFKQGAQKLADLLLPYEHQLMIETLKRYSQGSLTSFKRVEPLILQTELKQLERSKESALRLYS